jgi:CBS domain-containing protein
MTTSEEKETTVKQIMTKAPVTLTSDDILDLADDVMNLGRIRHMPVVDGGKLVGILSQRDLLRSALMAIIGFEPGQQKSIMRAIRVGEVMHSPVTTIEPKATVKEAARLMAEKKIGCLPVLEGDNLVGLVTETDILRHVAQL